MGTVRGDFCIDVGRNICHGSDAVESATQEIALWFKPEVRTHSVLCCAVFLKAKIKHLRFTALVVRIPLHQDSTR
jgi:hypothetical protein